MPRRMLAGLVAAAIAGTVTLWAPWSVAGLRTAQGTSRYQPRNPEDTAWIVDRGGSFKLPFAVVHDVLTSLEFTRLEPAVIDKKVYAPGLGIVVERAVTGPREVARLVSVRG
jgi:hypothetical protein